MTRPRRSEDGIATLAFPLVLAVALMSVIALIDLTGYLVAAARAQQAADAAALAALSCRVDAAGGDATAAAVDVVAAAGARLESCSCGGDDATVEVSVAVPGLVVPRRVGASRITATAGATLADVPAGPRPDGPATQPWRPVDR
ncbi:MAG TPA: hypothetical protein VK906_12195 [Egicoccus sp.]|nr:hypothetical protein [Egicoccus sp.]HSK23935.1 hypothetical protein [Egicoccus sp.]